MATADSDRPPTIPPPPHLDPAAGSVPPSKAVARVWDEVMALRHRSGEQDHELRIVHTKIDGVDAKLSQVLDALGRGEWTDTLRSMQTRLEHHITWEEAGGGRAVSLEVSWRHTGMLGGARLLAQIPVAIALVVLGFYAMGAG